MDRTPGGVISLIGAINVPISGDVLVMGSYVDLSTPIIHVLVSIKIWDFPDRPAGEGALRSSPCEVGGILPTGLVVKIPSSHEPSIRRPQLAV